MNVLDAAIKRLEFIFDEFDQVCFSVSGGKDSGVMVELANLVATRVKRKFDIVILDIEANYTKTVKYLEECANLENVEKTFYFCLPFYEDNNSSIFQPQWIMWNPEEEKKWIHKMPCNAITLENIPKTLIPYFERSHGNPDVFLRSFSTWYCEEMESESVAIGVGLRTQESLHRYRAIHRGVNKYNNQIWINKYSSNVYNFYPIYDWKVEDVWGAVSKYDFNYNHIYDDMYRRGVALSDMRICQPFGLSQRKGLDQYLELEPELWTKLVNRVSGANFGNLYSKTSLLGHLKTQKPTHMTWQEYAVFLLESYGLQSPLLRDHYYRKIKILMGYYEKNFGITTDKIVEESTRKEWEQNEALWHTWKGIAKALEKNDFTLSTRDYGLTKQDERELYELYDLYKDNLGIDNIQGKKYQKIVEHLVRKSDAE